MSQLLRVRLCSIAGRVRTVRVFDGDPCDEELVLEERGRGLRGQDGRQVAISWRMVRFQSGGLSVVDEDSTQYGCTWN